MYVSYFDEVKSNPTDGKDCYLVGGIVVKMENIVNLENQMTELSVEIFGTAELLTTSEFHASHIYFGKGNFKRVPPAKRLEVFQRIFTILSLRDQVKLVYACINTDKLYAGTDPAKHAFMHFVERVERAVGKHSFCILIGDLDDQQAKHMVGDFSRYRIHGTNSPYGKQITRIVDSVHFCRSHHSRMIQLADAYLFFVSGLYSPRKGWMADEFKSVLKDVDLFPNSYKEWPKS